ncbi:hypothetical protein LWI28_010684 [Acer negundo]|uniref:CCHC-type domain-containing protein n=1 Tax=Acer negundo TaxID=4023 RepID=A0AAD5NVD6_ACENE|nr:hypothetical protein LWI28_010684 [Acer negundo]
MQLLFEYQELWTVVSEGIVGPADAETTKKDLKARFFISQSLNSVIFEKIAHITSAKRGKCGGVNNTNQKSKSQIQCFRCKRYGHYKYECKSNGRNFQANVAEDGDYSKTLLLACNVAVDDGKYFLDTGCSNNMCGRKEMFSELDETFASEVKFRNNSKVPVMGKGKISISLNDGSKNTILEVLFVPSLHQNLLSMGQLSEKLYDMRIYRGVCTINDEHKGLIAKSCDNESSLDIDVGLDEIDGHPRDDPVLTLVAPPSPVNPHLAESSCRPQREWVLPARLQDCVLSNDDDPTDEELVNFSLFADCDPITYEDAAHNDCWLKAMEEEIEDQFQVFSVANLTLKQVQTSVLAVAQLHNQVIAITAPTPPSVPPGTVSRSLR